MITSVTRSQRGFSLVTALCVGVIGTLILTAMFSAILPTLQGVTKTKTDSALREAAESGLDYVTAQIAAGGSNAAAFTPSTAGGSLTVTLPPSSQSGSPLGDFGGINVAATATISDTACPTNSYLYAFELDPSKTSSSAQVASGGNRWRVVTVTSTIAGSNRGHSKTLRAVLRPNYTSVPTTTTTTSNTTVNGWPYRAIAASGSFTGSGGITTNSYNSAATVNPTSFQNQYADVMSNGTASCNASSGSIGGDLVAAGDASNGKTTVSGSVIDNAPPLTFPPVPSHPSGAKALSPTELYVKNGSTLTLAGGDYYVTADSKGNAINVLGSLAVSGTVRLWVEGTSPTVTIKGLANSGVPSNFQLFYNPSNPSTTESTKGSSALINIGGNGDFRGVIYAPNADVDVSGSSNYYGSIVGNDVQLTGGGSGGAVHYDQALMNSNILQWNQTTTTSTTTNTPTFAWSKCVSWQEL